MKPFFVYILRCADGSYYVGHTDDLEQRFAQHQDGTFPGFTSKRRPVTLAWCAEVPKRENALERELQLKRWTRAKKEALIRDDWNEIRALARGLDRHERIAMRSAPPFDSAPGAANPMDAIPGRYAQGERDCMGSSETATVPSVRPEPFDSGPASTSVHPESFDSGPASTSVHPEPFDSGPASTSVHPEPFDSGPASTSARPERSARVSGRGVEGRSGQAESKGGGGHDA